MSDTDNKYVVFKRADFDAVVKEQPPVRGHDMRQMFRGTELPDAVVIRRQDLFAAPALATYAACIAIARLTAADEVVKKSLLDVADYFQRQAELAAAEGWKLPDV